MSNNNSHVNTFDDADLQKKAKDHLWMHFARQSTMEHGAGVPIIVKGEGHHIWDSRGKKDFEGLSGLFVGNAGDVWLFGLWCYAGAAGIDLADRVADYAPGDLNRVFFSTGGGEAIETAF